jgi:hypothetical protein
MKPRNVPKIDIKALRGLVFSSGTIGAEIGLNI